MTNLPAENNADVIILIKELQKLNTKMDVNTQTLTVLAEQIIGLRTDIHLYEAAAQESREYRIRADKKTLEAGMKARKEALDILEEGRGQTEDKIKRVLARELPRAVETEIEKDQINWRDIRQSVVRAVIVAGAVSGVGVAVAFIWWLILMYVNR